VNKKVAIVAVHGIGQHLAGETQDAMADLLLSLPGRGPFGSARQYKPFVAVDLQIPLQPVETGSGPSTAAQPKLWHRFTHLYEEQSAKFAGKAKTAGPSHPGQAGLAYTERLLREYKGGQDGNVYRTARLEGQKLSNGTDVDIYEVLWADLAKPNNTVLQFFLSLFQLILHLASLSRLAIDSGAGEGRGRLWEAYRALQRYAVRLFQIFIPLLEILILIALGSCLIEVWSTTRGHIWVSIALGTLGAIAAGIVTITKAKRQVLEHPWVWALRALVLVALGAAIPFVGLSVLGLTSAGAATRADVAGALLFWLIPGFGFLFWILNLYDDERKGVLATGIFFFAVSLGTFVWFLWQAHRSPCPETPVVVLATLWTAQLLLSIARWVWGAMVLCAIAASLLGSIAWRQMKGRKPAGPEWGRARAAVRTSRLALALPTLLFLQVTLLIWAAFLTGTRQLMPEGDSIFSYAVVDEAIAAPWYPRLEKLWLLPPWDLTVKSEKYLEPLKGKEDHRENNYALRVLAWTMGYHLPVLLALVAVTSFLLAWWALPSVLTESMIRRGERKPPRDTSDAVSLRMGTWLSRGLDATSVVTLLFWSATFLVPILYKLANDEWPHVGEILGPITFAIVSNTLIGFALLATIAKGAQTVLATVLDVDTYLRTSPIYATPRATIFERYISTLRYLRTYRDAQNKGYDSIVIVAHSLGALISGDLLYYLQSDSGRKEWYTDHPAGPKFTPIPLTLLTMGNPTRQLLNRFFPYLYDWVRPVPDNGMKPLPRPLNHGEAAIDDSAKPDPDKLGLTRWINAYRSGDYVGRSLWLDEWYYRPAHSAANPVPCVTASPDGKREEMCIGAGAHIHYMDDTAPDIAWKLDSLL
jgi:hypothetical protein